MSDDANSLRDQILDLVRRYTEVRHAKAPFVPGESTVPVSGKVFDGSDVCSLVDASLDFWLTTGRFNVEFERKLAAEFTMRHALSVNSGSSANLVALASLTSPSLGDRALVPGDEVITVAAGFPTTVNPSLLYGLVPVFLDVDLETYNVCVDELEAAISPRTRAIMLAHTLGNTFNLDAVTALAKKHGLFLVEDCCDALGATYRGKHVGRFGDIATCSFYPAHHITMGEGGAVLTNQPKLKRIAESIRDWGRDCWCEPGRDDTCGKRFDWELGTLPAGYDHKYIYSHLGFNLKITDMQAAVGLSQLAHLHGFIEARKRNFQHLRGRMEALEEHFVLPRATEGADPSWFGFPITIRPGSKLDRNRLQRHLDARKIGSRLLFGGNLLRQPYFEGRKVRVASELKNTDIIATNTIWLGVYPGLTADMLDYIVDAITSFVNETSRALPVV